MALTSTGAQSLMRPLIQVSDRPALAATKENELWTQLKRAVDTLRTHMVRVKTEGAKEAFEHVSVIIASLDKARDEVSTEWRMKMD